MSVQPHLIWTSAPVFPERESKAARVGMGLADSGLTDSLPESSIAGGGQADWNQRVSDFTIKQEPESDEEWAPSFSFLHHQGDPFSHTFL